MGFLDWWRRRAHVDLTDTDTVEDEVQILRRASAEAPPALRAACAAAQEVEEAHLFEVQRGGAEYAVVGVVLGSSVSEARLEALARELEAAAAPLRVGVEVLSGDTLARARELGAPLHAPPR